MIHLGEKQTLVIVKKVDFGVYLFHLLEFGEFLDLASLHDGDVIHLPIHEFVVS